MSTDSLSTDILHQIIEAAGKATPRPWAVGTLAFHVIDSGSVSPIVADVRKHPDGNVPYIVLAANHAEAMAREILELRAENHRLAAGGAAWGC